jgi:hypothetical protein
MSSGRLASLRCARTFIKSPTDRPAYSPNTAPAVEDQFRPRFLTLDPGPELITLTASPLSLGGASDNDDWDHKQDVQSRDPR